MAYTLSFDLNLGVTGLTLEAQLVDTAGANVGAVVTTGFVEIGTGFYLFTHTAIPDGHRGGVKIQDLGGGTLRGFRSVNPEEAENLDVKTSAVNIGAAGLASVNAEVDTALSDARLNELMVAALASQPAAGSLFGDLSEDNAGTQRFTSAALFNTWESQLEGTFTGKQMMRIALAALAADAAGMATGTGTFASIADTGKTRISAGIDPNGNRNSIIYDVTDV